MSLPRIVLSAASVLALAACSGGNLRGGGASGERLSGPTPPPIRDRYFDPYAMPGDVHVTWIAPVRDRYGTIVRPRDPVVEESFQDYANAPWSLSRGNPAAPPGTY